MSLSNICNEFERHLPVLPVCLTVPIEMWQPAYCIQCSDVQACL